MSTTKKIIAVAGATGTQGGAVVTALLENGVYAVRALTRNPDSDKAKDLKDRGCEIVAADTMDVDSLTKALEGAYGAFLVTNVYPGDATELQEGKNWAEAAKTTGVEHVVFSALEDTRPFYAAQEELAKEVPFCFDEYRVPHFDLKFEASEAVKDAGVPTTKLFTSFFMDNFVNFGMGPQSGEDGELGITFCLRNTPTSIVEARDIGRVVAKILEDDSLIGKDLYLQGEALTGSEMAAKFEALMGKPVKYNSVPRSVYATFPFPLALEYANMFDYYAMEPEFVKRRESDKVVKTLVPDIADFDAYLEKNKAFFQK